MGILVIIVNPRGRFTVKIDLSFFYYKDYGCAKIVDASLHHPTVVFDGCTFSTRLTHHVLCFLRYKKPRL